MRRPDLQAGIALFLGLGVASPAWAGACEAPVRSAELGELGEAVATAFFETSDQEAFQRSLAAIETSLPCLEEPITPSDAAQVHLAGALQAVADRRDADVVASLRAAVSADPDFDLSETQAPAGGPLRLALEEAREDVVDGAPMTGSPECVTIYVDGKPSQAQPQGRPSVVQALGPDDVLLWTSLVPAGAAVPAVRYDCPKPPPTRTGVHVALGSGAAASAAAAGVFWWRAAVASGQFDTFAEQVRTNSPELDGYDASYPEDLQSRANGFSTAAIGAGVVAAGLGAALVFTW